MVGQSALGGTRMMVGHRLVGRVDGKLPRRRVKQNPPTLQRRAVNFPHANHRRQAKAAGKDWPYASRGCPHQ